MKFELKRAHTRKVAELSIQYSQKGYEVLVEPDEDDVPGFFKGYRPDIIAYNGRENVIIEVAAESQLKKNAKLNTIAEIAENNNWRFEIILIKDPDEPSEETSEANLPNNNAGNALEEAASLYNEKKYDSALLMAWSAIESLIRNRLHDKTCDADIVLNYMGLFKKAYSLGELSETDYNFLHSLSNNRNNIAHGFVPDESFSMKQVEKLLKLGKRLSKKK